ncbi:TPA: cytochrome c biogenesis heme-transporting ATPase CcmA [Legionella feeleii]|uniref:Heme exporter ATP-binding protein CcmA n=1 Tax=Legionella feeleii TaxID=453 RepID=A0A378J3H0_9GAMM|nr:cytochrome c biogenesis heme-transporting ATPase CcmA [Legionella feeleii]STX38844.1 heme exporter ATP-binding protein CcmA [Legionella feeleii]
MLDVQSLTFDYQDKPLLQKVQFSVAAGQLLHLRGNNGAGKTTLLKLLTGLLQPHEGEIRYDGQAIMTDLAAYQQKLCYVGHKGGINPLLTIKENCFFDMHWGRRTLSFDHLLAGFGLQGFGDEMVYHLSAGQRRRVGLLRIAMTDAKLWLLDEPLVALDKEAISTLMTCLESHLARGGQVILTSHQNLPLNRTSYQEYSLS